MTPPRPPSDAPSPVGLAVAGVGLAILCVSMMLPRVKVDDPENTFGSYSFAGLFGLSTYSVDTPTVVMSVALLAAVGISAHRSPALRWPARLGAIGSAALTAAFSYHPVMEMRQFAENSASSNDYYGEETASAISQVEITADGGVYLVVIGVALLAVSTFFMQRRLAQAYAPPPPAPAGWPGAEPTITVNPG